MFSKVRLFFVGVVFFIAACDSAPYENGQRVWIDLDYGSFMNVGYAEGIVTDVRENLVEVQISAKENWESHARASLLQNNRVLLPFNEVKPYEAGFERYSALKQLRDVISPLIKNATPERDVVVPLIERVAPGTQLGQDAILRAVEATSVPSIRELSRKYEVDEAQAFFSIIDVALPQIRRAVQVQDRWEEATEIEYYALLEGYSTLHEGLRDRLKEYDSVVYEKVRQDLAAVMAPVFVRIAQGDNVHPLVSPDTVTAIQDVLSRHKDVAAAAAVQLAFMSEVSLAVIMVSMDYLEYEGMEVQKVYGALTQGVDGMIVFLSDGGQKAMGAYPAEVFRKRVVAEGLDTAVAAVVFDTEIRSIFKNRPLDTVELVKSARADAIKELGNFAILSVEATQNLRSKINQMYSSALIPAARAQVDAQNDLPGLKGVSAEVTAAYGETKSIVSADQYMSAIRGLEHSLSTAVSRSIRPAVSSVSNAADAEAVLVQLRDVMAAYKGFANASFFNDVEQQIKLDIADKVRAQIMTYVLVGELKTRAEAQQALSMARSMAVSYDKILQMEVFNDKAAQSLIIAPVERKLALAKAAENARKAEEDAKRAREALMTTALAGTWKGGMECSDDPEGRNGYRSLTLALNMGRDGIYEGDLHFYPDNKNLDAPEGKLTVTVSIDPSSKAVQIRGREWLIAPFYYVDRECSAAPDRGSCRDWYASRHRLNGSLSGDAKTIDGLMDNFRDYNRDGNEFRCGNNRHETFELQKVN